MPPGWEYLTHAATRAGFTGSSLRKILRFAGAETRLTLSPRKDSADRVRHRVCIVWPADVDAAIAEWHASAPLQSESRRAGVSPEYLRRLLAAVGVKRRKNRRPGCAWRVRMADVDAAMRLLLETEPLEVVARRLGMDGRTLAKRLVAVGVTKPGGPRSEWRVSAADVQRALGAPAPSGPRVPAKPEFRRAADERIERRRAQYRASKAKRSARLRDQEAA